MRIPADADLLMSTIHRHWAEQQRVAEVSARRLATGTRVTSAVDDAAGLSIARRFETQAAGMRQTRADVQDGIAMIRTADGVLSNLTEILNDIRVVALQSANGTYDDRQRGALQVGVTSLLDTFAELVREIRVPSLLETTTRVSEELESGPAAPDVATLGLSLDEAWRIGVGTAEDARSSLDILDEAIEELLASRSRFGASENRLAYMLDHLGVAEETAAAAASRITEVDIGAEVATMLRARALSKVGVSLMHEVVSGSRRALQTLLDAAEVTAESTGSTESAQSSASGGATPAATGVAADASRVRTVAQPRAVEHHEPVRVDRDARPRPEPVPIGAGDVTRSTPKGNDATADRTDGA